MAERHVTVPLTQQTLDALWEDPSAISDLEVRCLINTARQSADLYEALEGLRNAIGKLPATGNDKGLVVACLCEADIALSRARGEAS